MLRLAGSSLLFGGDNIILRVIYLLCGIAVFVLSFYVATNLQVDSEEAKLIVEQIRTKNVGIGQIEIFLNNLLIGLSMFIPAVGAGLGVYSGIETGMVISALGSLSLLPANFSAIGSVILTPFGILEIIAYGIAISRSGLLTYKLIKRKKSWKKEYIYPTLIEMAIFTAILLIGSIIEGQVMAG
jgi:uncharacterized membrane protein SpoIIM required for sporulation